MRVSVSARERVVVERASERARCGQVEREWPIMAPLLQGGRVVAVVAPGAAAEQGVLDVFAQRVDALVNRVRARALLLLLAL